MGLEHIESWTGKRIEDETANSEGVATKFAKNDVLFGKLRPYLAKVYLAEKEGMATTEALVMMTGETLLPSFLKYVLISDKFINSVSGTTYGVKMPRANWEMIGSLPILLPPTKEQEHIAAFLDWKTGQIDAAFLATSSARKCPDDGPLLKVTGVHPATRSAIRIPPASLSMVIVIRP